MSQHTFRLAEKRDIPFLIETLTQSFSEDPVLNWLLRKDEYKTEALRDNMTFILDWFYPAGEVYTSEDGKACSIWVPSGYKGKTFTEEEKNKHLDRKVFWTTPEGLWRLATLIKLEEEKTPSFNHMHLGCARERILDSACASWIIRC